MRVLTLSFVLALFLLFTAPFLCHGQRMAAGILLSPKEVGVNMAFGSKDQNSFALVGVYADMQGLIDAKAQIPGVSVRFSRENWISWWEIASDTRLGLYAGIGIMAGYVRDLDNIPGWTLALSGNTGTGLSFQESRLSISAGFSIDIGLNVRDTGNKASVRFYRSGIVRGLMPNLTLMWGF